MNKPNREVNGSGRVLFRVYRDEVDYSANAAYGGVHLDRPTKRVLGELMSGTISEWSPSGEHVEISGKLYHYSNVEIVEVLPLYGLTPLKG